MAKLITFLLLVLLSINSVAADYPLEIIDLKGRRAEDIVPLVKPFIGPHGTLVGKDNKLIVRAAPERLREIRKIVAEIDRPLRRLMISVRRGYPQERTGQRYPKHGVSMHSYGMKYHSRREHDLTQKIQTVEGSPAFINTGRSVPIHNYYSGRWGRGSSTYYRDAVTGFYVVPRLNGDRVTLAIHQRAETPSHKYPQHDMQFDLQEAQTIITGRMGEWISIAGVDSTAERDQRDGRVRGSTLKRSDQTLQVLVEEVN